MSLKVHGPREVPFGFVPLFSCLSRGIPPSLDTWSRLCKVLYVREERLSAKGFFGIDAHSRYLTRCVLEGLPADGNATLVVSLGCDEEGAAQCKFKVLAISSC